MTEKDTIEYCKRVDDVLSYWVSERMKGFSGKQYGKLIIEELMNDNPIRQEGADYGRQEAGRDDVEGVDVKDGDPTKGSDNQVA